MQILRPGSASMIGVALFMRLCSVSSVLVILFLTIFDIYQNKPTMALKTWKVQTPKIPPHDEITRFDGTGKNMPIANVNRIVFVN